MSAFTNYKVVHIALVAGALIVLVLRNHGILSTADVDAAVAALGSLGIGLNINLTGSKSATAVVNNYTQAAKAVEDVAQAVTDITPPIVEVPTVAPPATPSA